MATPNQFSAIMTTDGISFSIDYIPYECRTDHVNYQTILEAIRNRNYGAIADLVNPARAVAQFVSPTTDVTFDANNETLFYKGNVIRSELVTRILVMIREGFDATPLVRFLENLYQNPSCTAVNELYGFLVAAKLPITDDGHFLAYKRVNGDYTSCHDGKTDNSIGAELKMERNLVDDNRNRTCSTGFHFCSFDYLSNFGGSRTVVLKVNPADVVSIPSDYNDTKGRACRYVVVGEVDHGQVSAGRNVLGECKQVVKDASEVPTVTNAVVAETPADEGVNVPATYSMITGYDHGYRHGRYKTALITLAEETKDATDINNEEFLEYFQLGLKHGKAHKSRLFK